LMWSWISVVHKITVPHLLWQILHMSKLQNHAIFLELPSLFKTNFYMCTKTLTLKVPLKQPEWAHALLSCSRNNWEKWLFTFWCLFICLSGFLWNFLYWRVLLKCHNPIQFWLQNDKNSRHLTWRTM
jgi:hypothetical protein